jgi:3-hydroxybutyryl-CoA dehydrogenase
MTPNYAVVGSGYMGGGIAQVLALSGARVAIADSSAEVALASCERLVNESKEFVAEGLFPPGSTEVIRDSIRAARSVRDAVADASFVEEAVPEMVETKNEVLAEISQAAPTGAIIATNTSTISIAKLATAVNNPERFLGVHFSNPAPFIPGVELIPHSGTAPAVVARAEEIVTKAGKQGARAGDVTGFVLNRLQYALFHEATKLVEEGTASAKDIDTIVRTTFGFRLPFFGPFAVADMAGLDVYAFCYKSLQTKFHERFATPRILAELVEAGKLGTKSGGGFLDTPANKANDLVAYRNKAYVAMKKLVDELGPAPIG